MKPVSEVASPRDAAIESVAASAAALERLQGAIGPEFDRAAEMLIELEGKVVTLGVGKSGHAAEKVAGTLRSIGVPASHMSSLDALHGDLGFVGSGDLAILFSKSGATRELTTLLPHLRARGLRLVAIVGDVTSPLGRECDVALDASVEREGCPLGVGPDGQRDRRPGDGRRPGRGGHQGRAASTTRTSLACIPPALWVRG